MNCKYVAERIEPFCSDELPKGQSILVYAHMRRCASCANTLADLRRLNAILALTDPIAEAKRLEPGRLAFASDNHPHIAFAKRVIDIIASIAMLTLTSLLLVFIMPAVWYRSPGPLFSRLERIGKDGKRFWLYRFRTTYQEDDANSFDLPKRHRTYCGQSLHGLKLDRLPEFFNVLIGEMSLIGPTAYRPEFVEMMIPEDRSLILSVPPGITGRTQLRFRYERLLMETHGQKAQQFYREILLPIKCRMEVEYVTQRNALLDVIILMKSLTIFARADYYVPKPKSSREEDNSRQLLYALANSIMDAATLNKNEIVATYMSSDACRFRKSRGWSSHQ